MTSFQKPQSESYSGSAAKQRTPILMVCWVVLYSATLLLPTLGGRRVLTRHEVLAAEPAREMLHGGHLANWIIPQFAGVPREVKPPTTGWIIAASMAIFHGEAEWVARLPAGLTAVFISALVALFTRRWLGTQAGLLAGMLQATFAYMLVQGRLAEADIFMCAAVCLAMYAFAVGNIDGPTSPSRSRWLPILFYFGAGASCLIKGVGPIFILPPCLIYVLVRLIQVRDLRPIRFLLNPAGLIVFAVLIGAWPIAAWRLDPGIIRVWHREMLGRASGEFVDRQPWYFYGIAAPAMLLPWLPFAIVGFVEAVKRNWLRRPISLFLFCWFSIGIFILSLSAFKHQHYAIPMLPPVTLVTAAGIMLWLNSAVAPRKGAFTVALIWLGVIGMAIVAVLVLVKVQNAKYEIAGIMALLAVGGAAVVYAMQSGRPLWAGRAVFATAWAISLCVGFLIFPRFDDYRWSANLARRANAIVPPGQTVYFVKLPEHHCAYYLRLPIARVDRDNEIPAWLTMGTPGDRYAVCSEATARELRATADVVQLDRVEHLRRNESEADRPVLVRVTKH